MRKTLLTCLLICVACGLSAYESGQFSVGLGAVYSPLEVGTEFGEINIDNTTTGVSHDAKLGKPGIGGELQALYFLNPYIGLGISFADQYFASDLSSGWYVHNHARMQHYMGVGHIFLTPKSTYKVYLPLGIGAAHTDFVQDFSPRGDCKHHFKYTGFSYYVGVGIEREITSHWNIGFETRYNRNKFHASSTALNGDHLAAYPRANFFSLILRAIYTI